MEGSLRCVSVHILLIYVFLLGLLIRMRRRRIVPYSDILICPAHKLALSCRSLRVGPVRLEELKPIQKVLVPFVNILPALSS